MAKKEVEEEEDASMKMLNTGCYIQIGSSLTAAPYWALFSLNTKAVVDDDLWGLI